MGCVAAGQASNFHEAYILGGKIWQGEFTQVRVCKKPYEIEDVAVRVIDLRKPGDPASTDALRLRQTQNELRIMAKVGSHPNVVQFMEAIWEGSFLYIVHDCCDYSLLYILERLPYLNEQTLSKFFKAALLSLQHIHSRGIVHCDVRLDNFLVTGTGFTFKLTGFRHARTLLNSEQVQGAAYLYSIGPHPAYMSPFMSPEMIGGKGFDYKTDLWSLGVVVYLLFYGTTPYKPRANTEASMKEVILAGEPPPSYEAWMRKHRPTIFSAAAMTFLKALLDRNADERPTASEGLTFPYMKLADSMEGRELAEKQKLLPQLCGALKAGGFEHLSTKEDEENDVDALLNESQSEFHGPIQPWTPSRQHISILVSAMDATLPAAEEKRAMEALRTVRQGETARQLGQAMRGLPLREGEFSIALGDLKQMRRGDVFNDLHKVMPSRSADSSPSLGASEVRRKKGKKGTKGSFDEEEEYQEGRQRLRSAPSSVESTPRLMSTIKKTMGSRESFEEDMKKRDSFDEKNGGQRRGSALDSVESTPRIIKTIKKTMGSGDSWEDMQKCAEGDVQFFAASEIGSAESTPRVISPASRMMRKGGSRSSKDGSEAAERGLVTELGSRETTLQRVELPLCDDPTVGPISMM